MKIELINCDIKIGKKTILKDVSFDLKPNTFYHLKGKNGSGKTVFLQSLLGFNKATGNRTNEYTHKDICYIPDVPFFSAQESVSDVLKAITYFYDSDLVEVMNIMEHLKFDPTVLLTQKIASLSKGTQKKLELIPLFLKPMKCYLLDEITHGLDTDTLIIVCSRLQELSNHQTAMILTEHNQHILQYLKHLVPNMKEITCVNQKIIKN